MIKSENILNGESEKEKYAMAKVPSRR